MATTRLMPIHAGMGRTIAKTLRDSASYIENPDKTDGGELISTFECDAQTADIPDMPFALFNLRRALTVVSCCGYLLPSASRLFRSTSSLDSAVCLDSYILSIPLGC